MRDGAELARSLANIAALTGEDKRAEQLSGLIQPYIQVVSEDSRDE